MFFTISLQLLEKLLQTYVCTWYTNFSANPSFVHQIRLAISTATRDIAGRLFRSDISEIIFSNLIPIALQHSRDWKALVEYSKPRSGEPEDWVADFMGQKIHPAAYSRESELNYLRGIVTALLPQLLPSTYISTNNKVRLIFVCDLENLESNFQKSRKLLRDISSSWEKLN